MFNLKRRPRRTGLRAALLAGAAIAAFGVSGVSAGTAAAATNCGGASETTVAGSTLQKVAQTEIWGPTFCTAGTSLKYEGIGSQEGLNRWGANGGAFQTTTQVPISDDAPNATQLSSIKTKAGGEAGVLTIPLAQAAIAIIAHPPTGCVVSTISQTKLQEVLSGEVNNWSTFGCASATINRVVREDGSGTTYNLKHYLGEIATGTVKCSGGKTWFELGEANPNTVWPESAKCVSPETIPAGAPTKKSGGGGLATYVNETEGTFGYASLSDVQGKANITTLSLQNNTGTATFGFPSTTTAANVKAGKAKSNCDLSNKIYNKPSVGGVEVAEWKLGGAAGVDWSHVFGTNPMIREKLEEKGTSAAEAQKAYPLCALTYGIGLTKYLKAGIAEAKAKVAIALLTYEVESAQQTSLVNAEKGYGRLFTTPGPLEAAGEAVNKLGL